MSNISVTIHSFRFGDLNYSNDKTYFLGYSTPMFNGLLSVETEHWKTHELMFSASYETGNVVILNDIKEYKLGFQSAFLKADVYERLMEALTAHIKANIEPLEVYVKFVNESKALYKEKYAKAKLEYPDIKPSIIHRKMLGGASIYTDHFDLSKVIGTITFN
jgi:hypothetical protein